MIGTFNFRLCATDGIQGIVAAFTKVYEKLGGKIVVAETVNSDDFVKLAGNAADGNDATNAVIKV